ncbi:MAG: hypothetical protein D6710_00140 [Nitrospirae bacterium]|nr:MAG: hypothetical protein D6710_00140 [Nitrospirota bacterium]
MFKEILTREQTELLDLLKTFNKDFYMAGGTALALQIGHRRSVDFDLFTEAAIDTTGILRKIKKLGYTVEATIEDTPEELSIIVNNTKLTFLEYPFKIEHDVELDGIITMPHTLTIAAMKAYTLGRRGKWKDYIDFYFIFKYHFSLKDVVKRAKDIYGGEFNERLFREQLCYFEDIDFTEDVIFTGEHPSVEEVKEFLINKAVELPLEEG